jgi:tricorn protease
MRLRAALGLITILTATATASAAADGSPTRLLRFPDIHGDQVVFTYAGDLWLASTDGGTARRLTAHPGLEVFPRFSPDGRHIAFTGQYDGDEQVYVISADGGEPRRLTWYPARGPLPPRWGFDHQVYGWTRDGQAVLFRSLRDAGGGSEGRLYTVPLAGGLPTALPMPTSGAGDFSPDGERMVYSPLFRDFRHWKRYEGGWAQDLYLFDLETSQVQPIGHSPRTERDPMWIGDTVYFVSDRDDRLNLYAADPATGNVEQLTFSDPWDVRWPSTDHSSRIVYELDGRLHVFDVTDRSDRMLDIRVPDDGLWKRPRRVSVGDQVRDFALSPKGERALFVARGEVFSAPIENGPTRNLTRSSGAHDRAARWSPDGRHVAYISDASGEEEIWIVDQAGVGDPRQLTTGHATQMIGFEWAPDGDRIAFNDYQGRLSVVTVADGRETLIADDPWGAIGDFAWSPGGDHLAFSVRNDTGVSRLHIWSVGDGALRQITSDLFEAYAPAWDPEGDYLFYISERSYAPQISNLEWNYAGNERDGLFALALRRDVEPILAPESDEVELDDGDDESTSDDQSDRSGKTNEKDDADDTSKDDGPEPVAIDFDGLGDRVMRIPVEPGNYAGLAAVKGHLLYASSGPFFYGRGRGDGQAIHLYSFEKRESSELVSGARGGALSADGAKLLVRKGPGFQLVDVKPNGGSSTSVSTSGMEMDLDPEAEWRQIFNEAWRLFRDYFYVENMHGYDWRAIGDRYRAQLDDVAHRSDLNYVISEMISELNAGHTYVSGGDFEIPERPVVGLPGARFELDSDAGRYRVAKIFAGHNEEEKYRSPLTEVGVDITDGDYILAVNGRPLDAGDNPYRLLQHLTDPVTLTVSSRPSADEAREVRYEPVRSEASLVYLDWVLANHARVTEMTDGRVGYLHIPDMGGNGIAEFIKWYYPQIRKQGLVVDVRSNGGGNVSQMIIERLDSTVMGTRFGRTSELPSTYPSTAFHGHMACLISETSASDGDIFPHYFREAGLGPLIGKRTWGGVVGGGNIPLVDGGAVFVPRSATNDVDGNYIIEGYGVAPDIEVTNDPASVLAGRDPQLERGVAEIMAAIERDPKRLPQRPADPIKTPR